MERILSTADIQEMTGWTLQHIQNLCRSGRLPATDVSLGKKKARYAIRQSDWEQFITPKSGRITKPSEPRRQRLDAGIKDKVL